MFVPSEVITSDVSVITSDRFPSTGDGIANGIPTDQSSLQVFSALKRINGNIMNSPLIESHKKDKSQTIECGRTIFGVTRASVFGLRNEPKTKPEIVRYLFHILTMSDI